MFVFKGERVIAYFVLKVLERGIGHNGDPIGSDRIQQ
jgi:hypothetical protein